MTTRQTVTGTGSPQNVVLEFNYINQSHVKVSVNGTPLAFSWVNPTTIQFTATSGQQVTVYRETPKDAPLVEFSSTNSVGSPELNLVARQALFAAQEVQDVADEAVIKGLNGKSDVGHGHSNATASVAGFMSAADKTKLDGVDKRSNHTGTQVSSTISDFTEAVQDVIGSTIVGGSNITVTYNDGPGTFVINATGELAVNWNTIASKPNTFPPSSHGHTATEVSFNTSGTSIAAGTVQGALAELDGDVRAAFTAIDGKANTSHSHAIADITSLQTTLDAKLPLTGGSITGSLQVGTVDASHSLTVRRHLNSAQVGGMLILESWTGSGLSGNCFFRQAAGGMQMLEGGGSQRGIYWDLTQTATGAASVGIHSDNLKAYMAAGDTQAVGKFIFAAHVGAAINPGQLVAGADLRFTSSVNTLGPAVQTGTTWRCCGYTTGAGQGTIYERVS